MLFNSYKFIFFLIFFFVIYWMVPKKYQWTVILISGILFYMSSSPVYILLVFSDILVTYFSALLIEKYPGNKKISLTLSLIVCIGILFTYKYFNFFNDSLSFLAGCIGISFKPYALRLLLPVGISFYTFQTLSYAIDVYKGDSKTEHNLFQYAAFILFFPQLVAGPIERAEHLLPQIKKEHVYDHDVIVYGLKLMMWGFFKKVVIADNLGVIVDTVYDNLHEYSGFVLVIAAILFSIQIYCDFSGYSDIARGTAGLFGIDLMLNFRSPYFSSSVTEFWERWHISLSQWIRDYIYIPMGGNRKGKLRKRVNLFVSFLVSGIWHGANITFIFWGILHGSLRVLEDITGWRKKAGSNKWLKVLSVCVTFILVSILWIFFRADTIGDALYVLTNWQNGILGGESYLIRGFTDANVGRINPFVLLFSLMILALYDYTDDKKSVIGIVSGCRPVFRWMCYYGIVLFIVFFGNFGSNPFVYFQF
ncbi:MAG: MBOAT family protein [Lachnospiraceae bacterium]|nr:MBOAT family protein [Lachnospiraceae bacterium]